MKKMKNLFMVAVAIVLFAACDKEGDQVKLTGNTSDVTLSVSSTADLTLTKAKENFSSLQFQWTNPGYRFTNGVNTQDITYTLQIDSAAGNFSNANPAGVQYNSALSASFSVRELNNALAGVGFKVDGPLRTFLFRVRSTLPGNNSPIFSNVVTIKIATYLDVVYPVPANLFMIGDATPRGWDNTVANLDPAQKFNKPDNFSFEIPSIALTGGKYYLLIPVAGSWANKYAFPGDKDKNNLLGDTFQPDSGADFLAPSTGNYKVIVNFKTAKITLVKL